MGDELLNKEDVAALCGRLSALQSELIICHIIGVLFNFPICVEFPWAWGGSVPNFDNTFLVESLGFISPFQPHPHPHPHLPNATVFLICRPGLPFAIFIPLCNCTLFFLLGGTVLHSG